MIKFAGMIMIIISSSLVGFAMSDSLSKRRLELNQAIDLIDRLKTQIRYSKVTLNELIKEIANSGNFNRLIFINECSSFLGNTKNFPKAWSLSLDNTSQKMHLSPDDIYILKSLSEILGATDVQGQISGLELADINLRQNLQEATEKASKKGNLFRSLGVLTGIAVAIMIA